MTGMGRRSRKKIGPYIPKLYIRELRQEQNLSMVQLLEKVAARGVILTEASLSRIERSIQPVDTPTLHAIAQALGASIATVMTGIRPDHEDVSRLYERLDPRDRAVTRRMMEDLAGPGDEDKARKRPKGER